MVDAEKKPWDPTLLDQFSEQGDSEFYTVTMTEDTATKFNEIIDPLEK